MATKERTADVFPLAAPLRFWPETRVWGPDPQKQTFVGGLGWLSSTTRWGCGYSCDGTTPGSSVGRFNSADPGAENLDLTNPISWNSYAYSNGDPVNANDPEGLATCGDLQIVGGVFKGRTVSQVMTGTGGNDLLAQSMWLESGTIYTSDLANPAAYGQDLAAVGSAILNQWDVDNHRLKVYQNGVAVCPLGQCKDRSLTDIILALERDSDGAIFSSSGKMRDPEASKLNGILNTSTSAGPLVRDISGALINQGCEGVISSLTMASGLISGDVGRAGPLGVTLLFWNRASPTSTNTFPGDHGYIGWRDDRARGQTFWGLSSSPVPSGPGGRRGR